MQEKGSLICIMITTKNTENKNHEIH
jgi:hypothetical protein